MRCKQPSWCDTLCLCFTVVALCKILPLHEVLIKNEGPEAMLKALVLLAGARCRARV